MTRSPNSLARLAAIAALFFLTTTSRVHASDALRRELAEVAKSLKILVDARGEGAIAIGQFSGPLNLPTSSGPGIAHMLAEELQKLKVTVKSHARLAVKGEFEAVEALDPETKHKLLAVQLRGTVEDSFGGVVTDFSFERNIPGDAAFLQLMGTPAELPADATAEQRDRLIRENLADPRTAISGARVSATSGSPYSVEILVGGQARTPTLDDGLAFVALRRGEIYAVRLINDSPLEAAVTLSIDGLSVFAFSELRQNTHARGPEPLYRVIVLPPRSRYEVRGWHRTNERSDSFQMTEYAKSAAASLNHHANLGTITATFAAAWPTNYPPPSDEAPRKKGAPDATGFGPRVDAQFAAVERSIGAIRSSVSVRYSK